MTPSLVSTPAVGSEQVLDLAGKQGRHTQRRDDRWSLSAGRDTPHRIRALPNLVRYLAN